MNRRGFLTRAGAAAALTQAALPAAGQPAPSASSEPAAAEVPPSERIVLGFIGVGQRGSSLLAEFLAHKDVEVAAIADVDESHRNRAAEFTAKSRGKAPDTCGDFRKLLENKDIDAVVVATPDHWHALPSILAAEAGKDFYVEKPLSHSILEGKRMIEAARRANRVTQMGIQIHNHPSRNYARVAAAVQAGTIGKVQRVACWKTDPLPDLGHPADAAPPAGFDYDAWLGPAPLRPYNPNRSHFNFRYFWDYAGGKFGDFGCHIMDVALWAMKAGTAKSAVATGGRFLAADNTETPDTMDVSFEYPGFNLAFSVAVGNQFSPEGMGGIGAVFHGTEGTIVTNYTDHKIFGPRGSREEIPKPEFELPPHVAHSREFLDSVKSRAKTSCDVEYGHALTCNVHLGNIAFRTGKRVLWNAEKGEIEGPEEAVRLRSREYRAPWSLA